MEKFRSRSDKFFLCKVSIPEMQASGIMKNVTRQYAIDAIDWAEAQHRITDYLTPYSNGMMEIKDIRPSKFTEIVFTDSQTDELWFSAKLEYIAFDENTGQEKRTTNTHLFQASSLDAASRMVTEVMGETMIDYSKTEIKDAKIAEVVEYGK